MRSFVIITNYLEKTFDKNRKAVKKNPANIKGLDHVITLNFDRTRYKKKKVFSNANESKTNFMEV